MDSRPISPSPNVDLPEPDSGYFSPPYQQVFTFDEPPPSAGPPTSTPSFHESPRAALPLDHTRGSVYGRRASMRELRRKSDPFPKKRSGSPESIESHRKRSASMQVLDGNGEELSSVMAQAQAGQGGTAAPSTSMKPSGKLTLKFLPATVS